MTDACAVIVFAKAPLAGLAKTRLIPALGADGAAQLAERLLNATLEQALAAGIGPVDLCCTPDTTHAAFAHAAQQGGVTLSAQGDGDLGARMHRALLRTLSTQSRALLIGTDAPGMDAKILRTAARALDTHDVVIGPALDGGYTLIGLRRTPRDVSALFAGVAWSTPQVLSETHERIARLGLHHAELAPLADVDVPADLVHVPHHWLAALSVPAPRPEDAAASRGTVPAAAPPSATSRPGLRRRG